MHVDNDRFFNCTFDGCVIIFCGRDSVTMDHCNFKECSFAFEGAAGKTVDFMAALYQQSPDSIERTFDSIRLGTPPN